MRIVIELSDSLIKKVKDHYVNPYEVDEICEAILDGTPLPKWHGRIIDESKITSVYYHEETYKSTVRNYHTVIDGTDAPTILDAEVKADDE